MPEATVTPKRAKLSDVSEEYRHYNKFRRKPKYEWKSVISGVFNDIFGEITNKVTNPRMQQLKLKIIGGFICCGLLIGHTYSAYRGFTRLSLYSRHLMVGGGIGTLSAFPVITFLNISDKEYPNLYMIIRGGIWGSICGLAHRGSYYYILPYGLIGISFHLSLLLIWYQIIKPIYYYHILSWPDYYPPKWWPSQPMTGLQIYLQECQYERLNVTYPEDLQYFNKLDIEKENKLKSIKEQEFQQSFIYQSEIHEKSQLENQHIPRNWFGL